MNIRKALPALLLIAAPAITILCRSHAQRNRLITTPGRRPDGAVLVTTNQAVTPIGRVVETSGARPKDVALSPDGRLLAVLTNIPKQGVLIFSADTGDLVATVSTGRRDPDALGIAWQPDGKRLYASCQGGVIEVISADDSGWRVGSEIRVDAGPGDPQLLGLAVAQNEARLFVAMGARNAVGVVSLPDGRLIRTVPVGAAPYRILLSRDGGTLYTGNRGGKLPAENERDAEPSDGTRVRVDPETDAALAGSVSIISLSRWQVSEVAAGRQPSGLAISPDDRTLYIADSDGDSIAVFDTRRRRITRAIPLAPELDPGFGQIPTSIALSDDAQTLFAACGGENAVAVVRLGDTPQVAGYLPAGWFPIAVAQRADRLYIASSKGFGPRIRNPRNGSYYVHNSIGTVQFVAAQDWRDLAAATQKVGLNNLWGPELEARDGRPPVPVPERVGEPSVFKHVVYIIKENQTYDSILGDMPEGNGDKRLNLYGEKVTPNHHKLARDYVLLDNTYTSGTNSADGHQWCDEAVANGYMEQNYDAHVRSYPYDGGDPLAYSPTGFLWTSALRRHLSVRVYGEFVNHPHIVSRFAGLDSSWNNLWKDRLERTGKFSITSATDSTALAPYLHPHYIGFPLTVSDQWRADEYLTDLKGFVERGDMPALSILDLPCDHTSGATPGLPSPAAEVADNDLALGRIVDGISHSIFWKDTLILVIEDDSQAAVDHVDGHRTTAFCISPYTRRRTVVSEYYNHTSLVRTIELALGLPAMTRFDRTATPLTACFNTAPDLRPYDHLPNSTPLDTVNKPVAQLSGIDRRLAAECARQDWSAPDRADASVVAQADWRSIKLNSPFPFALYSWKGEEAEPHRR